MKCVLTHKYYTRYTNFCIGDTFIGGDQVNDLTIPRDIDLDENALDVLKMLEMDSVTFVLFGATGDLAKRKIFPALYNLFLENGLMNLFKNT
jgi:hypothetical protein